MYLEHFGLSEPPFRITPHTDFFFAGGNRGAMLEGLLYAITHDEGIVKVSGEVGSGKTMLCRVLIERLPKNVETIFLASPSLSRDEILHVLADDLHVSLPGARATVLLRALQDHLIHVYAEGRRVVLLVDEAHAMPAESLEEVRLLSNLESSREKLLQIVLFGQPELDVRLAQPDMRQLRERITHSFRLQPLERADIESYLEFRLRQAGYRGARLFTPAALAVIAKASAGLTRRINILADKSLLAAYADGENQVSVAHARAAVRDSEFAVRDEPNWRRPGRIAAALAAGLAIGLSTHWLLMRAPISTRVEAEATKSTAALSAPPAEAVRAAQGGEREPAPTTAPATSLATSPATSPASATASPVATRLAGMRREEMHAAPSEAESSVAAATASLAIVANASLAARTGIPANDADTSDATPAEAAPVPPALAGLGRLTRDRFAATQSWLQSAPGSQHSIQLAIFSSRDSARMEDFLRQAVGMLNPSEIYVYSVIVDGRRHFRIAYGSFAAARDIHAALEAMPPALKVQGPFQRSVAEMRRLNQAS